MVALKYISTFLFLFGSIFQINAQKERVVEQDTIIPGNISEPKVKVAENNLESKIINI